MVKVFKSLEGAGVSRRVSGEYNKHFLNQRLDQQLHYLAAVLYLMVRYSIQFGRMQPCYRPTELWMSELNSGLLLLLLIALTVLPIGDFLLELPITLTVERGFF